jgi:hypothetical protein
MVARLRRGDEGAFDWLVEQHYAMLLRLALRYVPDQSAAERCRPGAARAAQPSAAFNSARAWDMHHQHPQEPHSDSRDALATKQKVGDRPAPVPHPF